MSLVLSIAYHQEVTENQERMSMLKHIYHMFEMHFESLLGGEISWENATSAILKALSIRGHPPCWKLIDSSDGFFSTHSSDSANQVPECLYLGC